MHGKNPPYCRGCVEGDLIKMLVQGDRDRDTGAGDACEPAKLTHRPHSPHSKYARILLETQLPAQWKPHLLWDHPDYIPCINCVQHSNFISYHSVDAFIRHPNVSLIELRPQFFKLTALLTVIYHFTYIARIFQVSKIYGSV